MLEVWKIEICNWHDRIFFFRKSTSYVNAGNVFEWVNIQCRETGVAQVKYNSLVAED